jgi:RNA polymerase subunit RPABC4/transcription elongation factor Spt4
MKVCTSCNTINIDGAIFCGKCGSTSLVDASNDLPFEDKINQK